MLFGTHDIAVILIKNQNPISLEWLENCISTYYVLNDPNLWASRLAGRGGLCGYLLKCRYWILILLLHVHHVPREAYERNLDVKQWNKDRQCGNDIWDIPGRILLD